MADLQVSQAFIYVETVQTALQVSQAFIYVEINEEFFVSLNSLTLQALPQNVSVISISAESVSLNTLSLISTLPSAIITPSAISVSVNELILNGLANDLSVQVGTSTILLEELILLTNAQTITISTVAEGRKYGPALQ